MNETTQRRMAKRNRCFLQINKKTLEMCFVSFCCCSYCCITICLTVYEPPWVFMALLVSIKNTAPGPKTFPTLWGLWIPGQFETKPSFTSLSKPLWTCKNNSIHSIYFSCRKLKTPHHLQSFIPITDRSRDCPKCPRRVPQVFSCANFAWSV